MKSIFLILIVSMFSYLNLFSQYHICEIGNTNITYLDSTNSKKIETLEWTAFTNIDAFLERIAFPFYFDGVYLDSIILVPSALQIRLRGTCEFPEEGSLFSLWGEVTDHGYFNFDHDSTLSPINIGYDSSQNNNRLIIQIKNFCSLNSQGDTGTIQYIFDQKDSSISFVFGKMKFEYWNKMDFNGTGPPGVTFLTGCDPDYQYYQFYGDTNELRHSKLPNLDGIDTLKLPNIPKEGTYFKVKYSTQKPASIQKLTENSHVEIYPNPIQMGTKLRLKGTDENLSFSVFNLFGQQVLSGLVSNQSVNISDLSPGHYFIQFQEKEGRVNRRFVVVE